MRSSSEYQQWWAKNSERVLANDEVRHNMNMKWAVKKVMSDKKLPKLPSLEERIEDALQQYEYYLNQDMVVLAMEYLNFASGLQQILAKKSL